MRLHANRVQRPADDVVTDAREVLDAAPRIITAVLLEVVSDARDVARDLDPVGQANASHLAERRDSASWGWSV